MMFLLASILMRLARHCMSFCKPFDALAGIESARTAIIFIVITSPFVSRKREPSFIHCVHPAPAPAYRLGL